VFVKLKRHGYCRSGQQVASGQFLCVFNHIELYKEQSKEDRDKLYACVRFCSMRQCGQWMMGFVRIGSQKLTVSGTYGSDGLPMELGKVLPENRKYLVEVPKELQDKFWAGGGWNSAGSEGPDMYEFGKTLLTKGKKT
jgi:hypothetical protein